MGIDLHFLEFNDHAVAVVLCNAQTLLENFASRAFGLYGWLFLWLLAVLAAVCIGGGRRAEFLFFLKHQLHFASKLHFDVLLSLVVELSLLLFVTESADKIFGFADLFVFDFGGGN